MGLPWTQQWFIDCNKWRGRVLGGRYRHWCLDWDGLPVDETTPLEFDCCSCFRCECGELMVPKSYPFGRAPLELHEAVFSCPKIRLWNFWKHRTFDIGM